jgi:hypothetical protein
VVASKEQPGATCSHGRARRLPDAVIGPARSLRLETTTILLLRRRALPASTLPASGEVGEPVGPVAGSPERWQNSQRQGEQGGKS